MSTAPSPIGVVLADDHAVSRRSLRVLLEREQDVEVAVETPDVPAAARALPRVVVLDLRIANRMSIERIRRLRAGAPGTEIVVVTPEKSPLFARQALDAGAAGLVLKDDADTELVTAIRRAARGEEYVSARVAAGLDAVRRAMRGDGLTPRETEVLRLIALGYTNQEIGARLHLSRRTVETHRANIHRKLGLTTRAELVQFALRRRMITA